MDKILQQIITELEQEKKEWLDQADNYYGWAIIDKAHAQGTASGLSEAIFIINKYMEKEGMDNGK